MEDNNFFGDDCYDLSTAPNQAQPSPSFQSNNVNQAPQQPIVNPQPAQPQQTGGYKPQAGSTARVAGESSGIQLGFGFGEKEPVHEEPKKTFPEEQPAPYRPMKDSEIKIPDFLRSRK